MQLIFDLSDYSRSETAFAIISLLMILMGAGFSVYAIREPRYMFKRLAAALHFITGNNRPTFNFCIIPPMTSIFREMVHIFLL